MDATRRATPVTVLVADDADSLRALVRITITSQGWSVIESGTADGARELARSAKPDLMLLDITFGDDGPDGLAVCAELKSDPQTKDIPIVILTAHDDPAERERAMAAGADAFVAKPFGPLDLMQVLRGLAPAAHPPALGVYLLDSGAVAPATLEHALDEQRALAGSGSPKRLGDMLVERGLVTAHALDRAILEQAHARAIRAEGSRTRVLVIDDHVAVREGLKSLMREYDDLEVVGEAADVDQGLRLARRHRPDVIVLDNEMPGRSGLDAISEFRTDVPSARLVMFSLESGVRERSLAAGADAFVVKDASMDEIVAAIRPSAPPRPAPVDNGSYVPPLAAEHRWQRSAVIIAIAFAAYAGLFFLLELGFGAAAGVFSVVPVVIVAVLLGSGAGLIAGAVGILLNIALWTVTGHEIGEPVLQVGVPGFGIVLLLLLGFGVGAIRDLGMHLDPRRARVDAIAGAVRVMAGLERGEFVSVFLEAMLRVVRADVALLYSNAAGDARFLAASRALDAGATERLAVAARDTMRSATPRVISELSAAERPLANVRSAVLVPISIAGQEVRGVLVLASAHPLSEADVARVRPFAQYFWIVLRNAPASGAGARARAKERPS